MQNRPPLLVPLNPNHPHCLDGLDHWLQLDLLDDDQVKRLCHQGLTCPLPAWEPESPAARTVPYRPPVAASPATPDPPPRQRSIAQAIKDEFSIRWLLGLGVFVVLISSAVLAASQWGQLPPAGQYGILWLYTLAFALTSAILEHRQRLTLTAQTLHTIVLGLIPLNFWAMDELGLWRSPLGWITLVLATLSLSFWLWQSPRLTRPQTALLLLFSLCHWGFNTVPGVSHLGLYLATLGGILLYRQQQRLSLLAVIAYGLGSICVRGLVTDPVALSSLGLAWGLLGWQVAQAPPPQRTQSPHTSRTHLGALFFICGWLLSLLSLSWQAIAITGLALHRLRQRLQTLGKPQELLLTALVALQGYIILGQLLPQSLRNRLWEGFQDLLGVSSWGTITAVLTLPYLLGLLWLTGWLRHQDSRRLLSQQGDAGIFLFGLSLALIGMEGFSGGWLLWLPLGAMLAIVIQRRYPQSQILANIAQLLLLGGIASLLDWRAEGNFSLHQWGLLLLSFALLEGLWTNLQSAGLWQTSAWQITQALGLSSYLILIAASPRDGSLPLAWWWWLLPASLGVAARYGVARYRTSAAWFAIAGAIALQILPFWGNFSNLLFEPLPDPRPLLVLSSGLGLLLLLPLVRCLRDRRAGAIAVGFGVVWTSAVCVETLPLVGQNWLLVLSLIPLGLWSLGRWGKQRDGELSRLYAPGCGLWGWLTAITLMVSFTLRSLLIYQHPFLPPSLLMVVSLGLLIVGVVIHQGRHLNARGLYTIGWGVELIAVEMTIEFTNSFWVLALVNIALGLLVQDLGNRWLRRLPELTDSRLSPLHTLPIIYGLIALLLRANLISPWAGLISVGASLILLTVGRQLDRWGRGFVYTGLLGLTLSSCELLLGQLSGFGEGDRGVALALLFVGWMLLYRGTAPQLSGYLRIPQTRLQQVAHAHWGLGTLVLAAAATTPIAAVGAKNFSPLPLLSGGLLTAYAIWQSRQPHLSTETRLWLYLGVAQGYGVLNISITISGTQQQLFPLLGAIAVFLAVFLYQAPWSRWGWHPSPWHQVARLLPLMVGVLTINEVHPLSLLAIALFYGILGQWERQVRWHYLGLAALCGLAVQGLDAFEISVLSLWLAPITLSILYITRVDPYFQEGRQRSLRHQIRLGTLTLFFAFTYFPSHWFGIAVLGLLLLLAGLGLKIRAFLFVGTAFFVITISEQLILLGASHTLSKWILGLGFGIILISIAALVESRKPQVVSTLQTWQSLLESWE